MNLLTPAKHLTYAKSLIAAARDQLARFCENADAHTHYDVDAWRVVKAADLLDEAATQLNGGQG